ncbi:MAG: polysaccharide biosynthesis tyrosine autokinase [Lysobacterales bacterium]
MQDSAARREEGEPESRLPARLGGSQALATVDPRLQALSTLVRGGEQEEEEKGFDFRGYWNILVKRRWAILIAFAIVMLTGVVATFLVTPIYRATAVIQIDRQAAQVVNIPGVEPVESPWYDREFFETQIQLLTSRSMAEKIASELPLDNPVFGVLTEPSWMDQAVNAVTGNQPTPFAELPPDQQRRMLVNVVRYGLDVAPIRNSRLLQIYFQSPDPRLAASVANAIAYGYIEANLERKVDTSSYAKSFLEDRLEQIKLKLQESEIALAEFAQRESFVNVANRETLLTSELEALTGALTAAKQSRIEADARARQAQGARAMSHPLLLENAGVQALRSTRAKLEAEYQEKLLTYKPAYPLMQQLRSQIEEIDKQLQAEVDLVRASLQAGFAAAQQQETMLKEQVDRLTREVLEMQGRSTEFTVLEREVETNRQLYDALLQRYKEIGITSNVEANNISIVDPALVPARPFTPNLKRSLLASALLGLVLGVALAFLLEYLDDTIKLPEDLERKLGLSILGVIPKLDGRAPEDALADPRSALSEAYRSVRTSLQFSTDHGVPKCLLITSPSAAEGKSTTAVALARNFAQLGRRVLLIDADLRNPSLHRILATDNAVGLSNYLAGKIKPAGALKGTKTLRLTMIPAGPLPPNPAELLAGPKMLSLVTLASEKFDQVIIDGPPVMGLADSPILSNMAAGTLLIVESGSTRIATAKSAMKRLMAARSHLIGAVLTKFDARIAGYGYGGYGDYLYYSYGGGNHQALPKPRS